jgi:3-phenylpropionate/trans-cinnamate dioxygenase ferredoxin subunit
MGIPIAAIGDVPEGEARRFEVAGEPVCVANLGVAGFRAVGDRCSHAEASLADGVVDVDEETVECPRHGSAFDLNTGRAKNLPATLPVRPYEVHTVGDDIVIEVS